MSVFWPTRNVWVHTRGRIQSRMSESRVIIRHSWRVCRAVRSQVEYGTISMAVCVAFLCTHEITYSAWSLVQRAQEEEREVQQALVGLVDGVLRRTLPWSDGWVGWDETHKKA